VNRQAASARKKTAKLASAMANIKNGLYKKAILAYNT
jgi:hypothetical protein